MLLEVLMSFLISIVAGIIGSLVGIGGGVIISPFLSHLNYSPSQISSTSLISVFSTSLSSSFFYFRKNLISRKIGFILSISSIPGTFFGVVLSNLFSLSEFKFYLAFILIFTSFYLIIKSKVKKKDSLQSTTYHISDNENKICYVKLFLLVFFSFLAGIISSCFGIGGGVIFVPSLIILYKFNMINAAATSQFALLFTSLSGLSIYVYYGNPNYFIGLILAIGSLLGGSIGSKISSKTNSNTLQIIFSIVLVTVSIKLLYDVFYIT
jgi:uncharacterized protein